VILYRAGRTAAGAKATASHTASIAGDYTVTCELAAAAGVLMADSLDDFEDLVRLSCQLRVSSPTAACRSSAPWTGRCGCWRSTAAGGSVGEKDIKDIRDCKDLKDSEGPFGPCSPLCPLPAA
jgi:hypothetical protein